MTKYVVSFAPGTSGRLVTLLLYNILLQKDNKIDIDEIYNNTHNNLIYTGISLPNPNAPNIYEILDFDDFEISILSTHVFPKFEILNSKFNDIKIILIKFNKDDFKEVIFNHYYKNKKIAMTWINLGYLETYKEFCEDGTYSDNCYVINYQDIFTKNSNGEHFILEKLKKIAQIEYNNHPNLNNVCETYIYKRSKLIEHHGLR